MADKNCGNPNDCICGLCNNADLEAIDMTEPKTLISWLRCFDDDEKDARMAAKCADALEDQQEQIEKLHGLLREWIKSEWMVTHDWGGDRDALLHKTSLLVDQEYDGSYAPESNCTCKNH